MRRHPFTAARARRTATALLAALPLAATLAAPLRAADFSDPDWPCIQRKVETLSPGLMWPEPIEALPEDTDPALAQALTDLSARLALRRVSLDEAETAVRATLSAHPQAADRLGTVFAQVFERLSQRRSRILDGIGTMSRSQIAATGRIDAARTELASLTSDGTAAPSQDAQRLSAEIDWAERIFHDRQQSVTYLCETPVLLEKRLYELSKLLQRVGAEASPEAATATPVQ